MRLEALKESFASCIPGIARIWHVIAHIKYMRCSPSFKTNDMAFGTAESYIKRDGKKVVRGDVESASPIPAGTHLSGFEAESPYIT